MWASRDGHADVVRALLAKGADASIKNHVSFHFFLIWKYVHASLLHFLFACLCGYYYITYVQSGKTALQVAKNEAIKALFRTSAPAVSTPSSTTDSAATLPPPLPVSPKVIASVPVVIPPPPIEPAETPSNSPKKDKTKEKNKEKSKETEKEKANDKSVPPPKSAHTVYPPAQDAFAMESPMATMRRQSSQSNQSNSTN